MSTVEFTKRDSNQNVSINIKDSKGDVLRVVYFNPHDARGVKILAEIMEKIYDIDEFIEDAEDSADSIIILVNALEDIFKDFDKIFGEGTVELLTDGVINKESVESIKEFMNIVMPFYQRIAEEREANLKPYIAGKPGDE